MLARLRQRSADLAAGSGWLDMTGGATADGKLIAVTRFAGEEGRRGAEDRHQRWWADAAADFEGDVTVLHSTDITAMHAGPDPAAGFVQMMLATVADRPTVPVPVSAASRHQRSPPPSPDGRRRCRM